MSRFCRGTINFSSQDIQAFFWGLLSRNKPGESLVTKFENDFAAYVQVKKAIAVSCAKTALSLGLKVLGAQAGDEIIVTSYTVTEVIDVIISSNLRPIFIDISLGDGNMDPDLIEPKITDKTKFILITHMHGNPGDLDRLLNIADKYRLTVIEDAAQACGAEYKAKKTGGFGKIAYFSFNMFKNLNTLGGAMLVTDDPKLAADLRQMLTGFRQISKATLILRFLKAAILAWLTRPFVFTWLIYPLLSLIGKQRDENISKTLKVKILNQAELDRFNVLFSPAQASVGLIQLKNLDKLNQEKINKAEVLNQGLSKVRQVSIFNQQKSVKNIYLNYVIRVADRQKLISFLFAQGIDLSPGFVRACAYVKEFSAYAADCPNSLILEQENVYLPLYSPLTASDTRKIAELIEKYYETKTRI
ncbi:MAG: DegT/DnrJ/EryC1/StrS family aminotransferase [Candidatus Omnitrophica bacterium]|nr:DegT/DnrJ/EryC1/StrS family aminotransferase [Candidatus Omnitrophota bacterium]